MQARVHLMCSNLKKNSALLFFLFAINLSAQEPQKNKSAKELLDLSVEELLNLDVELQVSSNKSNNLFNSPSTVTVIDKKTIQEYNFQTIPEALQTVAGVMVSRTYLKKDIPVARGMLQGHYANKILILINGIPTFNAITGEGILSRLNINAVERIEILKGPASVLYGTNAYSGAINIVLKKKLDGRIEAHTGIGSWNAYPIGVNAMVSIKDLNIIVSGNSYKNHHQATYFKDENNETGYIDDLSVNTDFTFSANYKAHKLLINGYRNMEGYLGVTPNFTSGAGNEHKLNGYLVSYNFTKNLSDKFTLDYKLSDDWNHRQLSRTRNDSIWSKINGNRIFSSLTGMYEIGNWLTIEFGNLLDYRKSKEYSNFINQTRKTISKNNLYNRSVIEHAYFLQLYLSLKNISATVGGRYTANSLFGSNISPRVSLAWQINQNNSLKTIYGESYRAPTLFEQYFINTDSTVFGNLNLKPEKNHSIEIAYLTKRYNFFIQLLSYYSYQMNKIDRSISDVYTNNRVYPNQFQYHNQKSFSSYGTEIEIKYNNPKIISSYANYTFCVGSFTDSLDFNNLSNLKFTPKHQYSFGLGKNLFKRFLASATYNGWSAVNGPIDKIPAQNMLNLSIGIKQRYTWFHLTHTLSFKNILDQRVDIPEYVRGNLNQVPLENGLSIFYTLHMSIY